MNNLINTASGILKSGSGDLSSARFKQNREKEQENHPNRAVRWKSFPDDTDIKVKLKKLNNDKRLLCLSEIPGHATRSSFESYGSRVSFHHPLFCCSCKKLQREASSPKRRRLTPPKVCLRELYLFL